MNRMYMKFRTFVLKSNIGKYLRKRMQIRSYKEENARNYAIEAYGDSISADEINAIVKDMMTEAKVYNVRFDEYIMYHFKDRDFESRREFIPTNERVLYCEKLNNPKNHMIFDDKGKTYEVFKKYFKRDLVEVVGWDKQAIDELKLFVEKHNRFIIKPFNGGNGRGIKIFDICDYQSFDDLCFSLKNDYKSGFVAEELIKQVDELAAVHKESVNTLRVFTILFDDRIEFLPLAWRVGRGNSCVDNGGSGGIFCALNDDGVIISTSDEKGVFYDVHPDTNHPLIGFKIPKIDEAKRLSEELAKVVPGNRYCGWDLALTDDGWVMQEGNWQGGIVAFQCPLQKGCRSRMDSIIKELNL